MAVRDVRGPSNGRVDPARNRSRLPSSGVPLGGRKLFTAVISLDPFAKLRKEPFVCPTGCGRTHDLQVKVVQVEPGAIQKIPEIIDDLPQIVENLMPVVKVLLVCDTKTYAIAGAEIQKNLFVRGFTVTPLFLPTNPAKEDIPYADEETADHVLRNVGDNHLLIGVGGGTVLDMTRLAAHTTKRPFMAVPTALSMNGFASPIVAIERKGVKETDEATPPVAVVCDLDILGKAPEYLRQSGYGDLMSKPTSFSDWLLGYLVKEATGDKKDNYFCELPMATARLYEARCIQLATAIKKGEKEGIEILARALINSGLSMVIAGSSSPASGGEHLISHLWDMTSELSGRQVGMHGTQVGVATIMVAPLYEEILTRRTASDFDWGEIRRNYRDPGQIRDNLHREFPELADEMIDHSAVKWDRAWKDHEWQVRAILARWEEIRDALQRTTSSWGEIHKALLDAGAVVRVADIKTRTGQPANIGPEEVQRALLYARFIRKRYTVLDLASDLGILNETTAARIIQDTGVLS